MDDIILARAVHVLAVLVWIGGVAFVTLVVMPSVRAANPPAERLAAFHRLEGRFAAQARIWVLLAGLSGFWMIYRAQMWDRFFDLRFWWMHAMVGLWAVFAAMLFVIEPLFLHRRMMTSVKPAADFARMETLHRILLGIAAVTVLGAVAGSHGF
ncbi:hypothetical protein GG804_24560 [Sphingomonas histidinilytica]|jgi:uncharacterized membrane protein|uniref:Membrane protein n=7 Tax=Sphingomonadaceae TaxID=41297 RepID=A0A086PDI5_SPHHM|nr:MULTISPECIES: hypothetical protein [Sphingomonadaceae]OAP32461.1 hypothetical protein A8O16_08130 [Sphingobium sp. 20006FA]API61575.1 hypothetical protein BSL82_19300 [Tardibacter chloracetimidivorans]ATE67794.1 hypothetical protein CMV14_24980 [Rhizorhabdus dicambivorans]EKU72495.1 hypothetical protein HMPREF9718_04662 [Sphingobium yanoikuyae ATCC 51230]KFG91453.1 Membrane protein [Sphingobium herbicidovorans NBRC 16415]